MYPYKVLKEQEQTIINLNEIKSYLRINYDYDDVLLAKLYTRAIAYAETFLRYAVIEKEISFKTTHWNNQIKQIRLPLVYCKKVVKIICSSVDNSFELKKEEFVLNEDKTKLEILTQKDISQLKILYKTVNILATEAWLQHGVLEHIRNMYDNKENIVAINNLYQPYRRILL